MKENKQDVQSESESVETTNQFKSPFKTEVDDQGRACRVYDIIPGRVMLVSRGSSDVDEIARRAQIESDWGLRLVPLGEIRSNRTNSQVGDGTK